MTRTIKASLDNARRLAIAKQHLAGPLPRTPGKDSILEVFRGLGCIQLDPISAVAPSHLIVLWNRLRNFDRTDLEQLQWRDKKIFEYWAHQSSLVLMEDYPLYYSMMRGYPDTFVKPWGPAWRQRIKQWMIQHASLQERILRELKQKGPLPSRQFEVKSRVKPRASSWESSSDASRMLSNLFFKGEIMVVGRKGNQKLWDLSENFLPSWAKKTELSLDHVEFEAAQRAIRALGTANASEIDYHFLRGRYPNLKSTLNHLLDKSLIYPIQIDGKPLGKGERYIHADDVSLLERIESDEWQPRTSLLSPFDNLICDRTRTKHLFNFDFTVEIYTPSHKRKYGYYVLPILYGDRFIGRIDPLMDRKKEQFLIKAVHAERNAPRGSEVSEEIGRTIENLSEFLGAREVVYSKRVPRFWRNALR